MASAGNDKFYTFHMLDVTTGEYDSSAEIRLARVTEVLSVLNKPFLMAWAAKFQRQLIATGVDALMDFDVEEGEILETLSDEDALEEWVTANRLRPSDHVEDRSEEGTEAHETLEHLCVMHPISPERAGKLAKKLYDDQEQSGYVRAVASWYLHNTSMHVLASEAKLISLSMGVAGTVDLVRRVGGKVRLTDLKTRKDGAMPYYDSDDYQTGAYELMWNERGGPQVDERSVLVAYPNGTYKETLVSASPDIFLACLDLFNLLNPKGVN